MCTKNRNFFAYILEDNFLSYYIDYQAEYSKNNCCEKVFKYKFSTKNFYIVSSQENTKRLINVFYI